VSDGTPTGSSPGFPRQTDASGTGAFVPPRILIADPLPLEAIVEALGDLFFVPEMVSVPEQVALRPGLVGVLLLTPHLAAKGTPEEWAERLRAVPNVPVVALGESRLFDSPPFEGILAGSIPWPTPPGVLRRAIRGALLLAAERLGRQRLEEDLSRRARERSELNSIGIALSTERNPGRLLELILTKAREMVGADAGSLYIVDRPVDSIDAPDETLPGTMRFVLAQNDTVCVPFAATTIPLSPKTIAGWVALTGETLVLDDAYLIAKSTPYSFNPEFDRKIGYRTKSMLVVPMKDHRGRVTGVLQLINRKKKAGIKLDLDSVERRVIPFDDRDVELSRSLASQAAVAIDNAQLIESIRTLFEGFVTAAVTAIEQRDPTTSGHSGRVAILTCGLAEIVDRSDEERFRGVRFTTEQMRELRYASLLHDFGKVGVREAVLVKARKLYPHELEGVLDRFEYVRRSIENEILKEKLAVSLGSGLDIGRHEALEMLDERLRREWADLDRLLEIVLRSNEPTILPDGNFEVLNELARRSYRTTGGASRPLLTPEEVRVLSIRKGSLDER
jgi:hypothetical protein